jgi:transposase
MSQPKSCWAPFPERPIINVALVREFRYIYASVCPWTGNLIYNVSDKMNTQQMNIHLNNISKKFPSKFVIVVLDGASSHRSKELKIPKNLNLIKLPPYSPELNPTEQIWRLLRGSYFGNKEFNSLDAAIIQAKSALDQIAADKKSVSRLTNWPWISAILHAH